MSSSTKPMFRNDLHGVDAYTRHKRLIQNYVLHYGKKPETTPKGPIRTEYDIIRDNHKFIRSDDEDDEEATWEQRVAKKYYDTLFKEYALCELKYYKEGKIALRWRTQREVVHGKGQFSCASTRCDETKRLESWEVNFGYIEHGEKKNELVKVRLCPECSYKLNYKTQKRQAKKDEAKRKRRASVFDDNDVDESSNERHRQRRRRRKYHHNKDDYDNSAYNEDDDSDNDDQQEDQQRKKEKEVSSIWSRPIETKKEKTKEEEFEDYFADLLQ
ncbi:folate-sensitive fragile site protein Fra10Ac1-domain-containing protein [Phascolomyces articulosus]|uniref:Folate-sensitive fragile site protein Fra10Ac1-domain-containing protein n=1 Tax=Phascolomyces articulosus TaxID=60185 RepID=A0AAD5K4W2_9FUNG|nr:folate-sensitive fragile site protein Fra10Ac1-domain-containing protein [Phascolomyces articulosus]